MAGQSHGAGQSYGSSAIHKIMQIQGCVSSGQSPDRSVLANKMAIVTKVTSLYIHVKLKINTECTIHQTLDSLNTLNSTQVSQDLIFDATVESVSPHPIIFYK